MNVQEFAMLEGYRRNSEQERKLHQIGQRSYMDIPVILSVCEKFPSAEQYRYTGVMSEKHRAHLESMENTIRIYYKQDGEITAFRANFGTMLAITCNNAAQFDYIRSLLLKSEEQTA